MKHPNNEHCMQVTLHQTEPTPCHRNTPYPMPPTSKRRSNSLPAASLAAAAKLPPNKDLLKLLETNCQYSRDGRAPRILGRRALSEDIEQVADRQDDEEKDKENLEEAKKLWKSYLTLFQHYYPEGGWGWVIVFVAVLNSVINHGLQLSYGVIFLHISAQYKGHSPVIVGWMGAMSMAMGLLISPLSISFCRLKSTRLLAVFGGLASALGCLFTSFASQFHQAFFSYSTVVGCAVGVTRDSATLMVGQYFKRRREFVEILVVSSSGLGISVMSAFIEAMIQALDWRLGLQAVTGVVVLSFFLGSCYRSASLYHPQRRAILHLKGQKKKVKEKQKNTSAEEKPPILDFGTLRSKTIQIILISTGISAMGINTPIIYMAYWVEREGISSSSILLLQVYLGLAWTLGCCVFGLLVVQKSNECRIGRQYLCQAAVFVCGITILALTAVEGQHGYVLFVWVYGIFCGGYHYSLKVYTYERVRARNFARAWGFVQFSQAIPTATGVPLAAYIGVSWDSKAGFFFSSVCVILGSLTLFLIDVKRRHGRHSRRCNSEIRDEVQRDTAPPDNTRERDRRYSFQDSPEETIPLSFLQTRSFTFPNIEELKKAELSCISEEGIADMHLPDYFFEEWENYPGAITSCDQMENFLMYSEFEQNMFRPEDSALCPTARRRSIIRQPSHVLVKDRRFSSGEWGGVKRLVQKLEKNRSITVIQEASCSTDPPSDAIS